MAKEKFVITGQCRIDGVPTKKGTIIELDRDDKREGMKLAELNRVGRVLEATKENVDMIRNQARVEEAREKNFALISRAAPVPA